MTKRSRTHPNEQSRIAGGGSSHQDAVRELLSRRSFVITSGGILLGISSGCGDGGSNGVSPTSGLIRVTVAGLDASGPGGSVSARKTNNTGETFSDQLPASGSTRSVDLVGLPEGDYNVTYTVPAGFSVQSTTPNPQVISVAAGAVVPANFAVSSAPAPTGIIFASDWRTGTGTSDAAKRDASHPRGGWSGVAGNASIVETAASLGLANWPTANAFVVRVPAGQTSLGAAWSQPYIDLGTPSAGSHRYFRVYVAMLWADSHGDAGPGAGEHGIESNLGPGFQGGAGGSGWNPIMGARGNGTWVLGFREISTGARYTATQRTNLAKFATYRLEWHCAYAASSYTVEVRLFDGAGNQVVSTSDLTDFTGAQLTGVALQTVLARHHQARVGCNGPTSNYPDTGTQPGDAFRAHGAFAVSDSDWVGPYANGI